MANPWLKKSTKSNLKKKKTGGKRNRERGETEGETSNNQRRCLKTFITLKGNSKTPQVSRGKSMKKMNFRKEKR